MRRLVCGDPAPVSQPQVLVVQAIFEGCQPQTSPRLAMSFVKFFDRIFFAERVEQQDTDLPFHFVGPMHPRWQVQRSSSFERHKDLCASDA